MVATAPNVNSAACLSAHSEDLPISVILVLHTFVVVVKGEAIHSAVAC